MMKVEEGRDKGALLSGVGRVVAACGSSKKRSFVPQPGDRDGLCFGPPSLTRRSRNDQNVLQPWTAPCWS